MNEQYFVERINRKESSVAVAIGVLVDMPKSLER